MNRKIRRALETLRLVIDRALSNQASLSDVGKAYKDVEASAIEADVLKEKD